MNILRDIRLLPVVLVAIGCLAILKIAGLVLDGGYVFDVPNETGRMSWARENLNFPGGRSASDPDVTGSIEAKPKDAPKEASKAVDAPPVSSDDAAVVNGTAKAVSPSERAILERLQDRRREIDARAREVEIREGLVKSEEKRLEGRTEELKGIEARISAANEQKAAKDAEQLKGLVIMYENMKPKDAARIFDRLDMPILIQVASQIAPRKMSDILGQMSSETAERLTVELARKAGAGGSDPGSNLPKIEGRPIPPKVAQ